MVSEHKWQLEVNNVLFAKVRAVRYVDDLIVVFHAMDTSVIQSIRDRCYPPELMLEMDSPPSRMARALECLIEVNDSRGLVVLSANKNEHSLMASYNMHFARYPHWACDT